MADEASKESAAAFFVSLGYRASAIPTADELGELRADLLIDHESESDVYVVETKSKAAHREYLLHVERLRRNGTSDLDRTVATWNGLSSVIEKAARQLEATPAPEHAVRLLWVSCLHADWDFVLEAIERRLLGNVLLSRFVHRSDDMPNMLDPQHCYYYAPADFTRYKTLDGAVLECPQGVRLLVNEFGERVAQLRRTRLHREMEKRMAVTDPLVIEAAGNAMAIRKPLPTGDSHARWKHLVDKYGVMTALMQEHSFRADLLIPRSAFESEDQE